MLVLGLLTGLQLGLIQRAAAGDFAALGFFLIADPRFGDRTLLQKPRLLDLFARGQLRLLGFLIAQRALLGQLGPLRGAAELNHALLLKPRIFALTVDIEDLLLRIKALAADIDLRALLDFIAHPAAALDGLGQLRQALGVE